ncbi:MAG: hypothetical protein QM536_04875 [Chitinophagaceae bacterium]|nr:hypothetical protein [Chitinophagaceae bacterium]
MKKYIFILVVLCYIIIVSCTQKTCPTYSKNNHSSIEKPSV